MSSQNLHISDSELLMAVDGELSPRRAGQIRTHLAACWNCRARMSEVEGTIVEFTRTYQELQFDALPPSDGPRALLSANLAALASQSGVRSRGWSISLPWSMRAAVLGVSLCMVAVIGKMAMHHYATRETGADLPSLEQRVVPDTRFTPGATRTATIDVLCSAAHEEVVGQVTEPLRNQVLREYKIANASAGEYEIDYLIAPGLGGAEDIRNLWPQPYNARTWNSYAKDALEERLHQLVCERKLDLAVAQGDIANNWITAYKKYFQTDEPSSSTAELSYSEARRIGK